MTITGLQESHSNFGMNSLHIAHAAGVGFAVIIGFRHWGRIGHVTGSQSQQEVGERKQRKKRMEFFVEVRSFY